MSPSAQYLTIKTPI